MNNGMIRTILPLSVFLLVAGQACAGEIYKVVDKDGNVTFTDQSPGDGAQPISLPELSVIQSEIETTPPPAESETAAEDSPPTLRELRGMYRDFRITQPENEETFWGTANTVVVSWDSNLPPEPDMSVRLVVNGESQLATATGGVSLTLDRGEHKVYAEIRDGRNRRIATTETVTFFIMQHSRNFR